jgi:hypothetical protein
MHYINPRTKGWGTLNLVCNCHRHKKLQEQELNQGHNKENKSQEM